MRKLFLNIVITSYILCYNISNANPNNQEDFILYQDAVYDFTKNEYYGALRKLQEFAKLHPESEYTADATVLSIVLYFLTKKKDDFYDQVKYFEQVYFLDKRLEYVYYIRLLMSYKETKEKKKSYDSIEDTIKYSDELLKMNTKYAENVKKIRNFAWEKKFIYMQDIADFYLKQKQYHSAIKTINALIDHKTSLGLKVKKGSREYNTLKNSYSVLKLDKELEYLKDVFSVE
jgi:outer membrane protein assembly factor BamD (BamD/ComL family)